MFRMSVAISYFLINLVLVDAADSISFIKSQYLILTWPRMLSINDSKSRCICLERVACNVLKIDK